jgi:hypothetical protein
VGWVSCPCHLMAFPGPCGWGVCLCICSSSGLLDAISLSSGWAVWGGLLASVLGGGVGCSGSWWLQVGVLGIVLSGLWSLALAVHLGQVGHSPGFLGGTELGKALTGSQPGCFCWGQADVGVVSVGGRCGAWAPGSLLGALGLRVVAGHQLGCRGSSFSPLCMPQSPISAAHLHPWSVLGVTCHNIPGSSLQ